MRLRWHCIVLGSLALGLAGSACAKDVTWVRVRSPHFEVVSDGGAGKARDVAAQLERMRSVFQQAIPGVSDPPAPIEVLAVKNKKDFVALTPADWLGKGKPDYAAELIPEPERNLILLRLDTVASERDPFPFGMIYGEYTNVLLGQSTVRFPDWLATGLWNFYYTADIDNHHAVLGKADPAELEELRGNRLLPVDVLFAADLSASHWQQDKSLRLINAECWALVHYLTMSDAQKHTHLLQDYLGLLGQQVDPVTAATRAFGDLHALQDNLIRYTARQVYEAVVAKVATATSEDSYAQEAVTRAQADGLRAEVLMENKRYTDARLLLDHALQSEPNDVAAQQSMGLLERLQGNDEAALGWYRKAVAQDSTSYLTQYNFATLSLATEPAAGAAPLPADAAIEASLRAAIRLNPKFAPADDTLASLYSRQRQNLDQARVLELQAITLRPSVHRYRYNYAAILMDLGQLPDAVAAAKRALVFATTPAERAEDAAFVRQATGYEAERAQMEAANQKVKDLNATIAARNVAAEAANQRVEALNQAIEARNAAHDEAHNEASSAGPPTMVYRTDPDPKAAPTGATAIVSGPIQSVYCSGSNGIDIALITGGKTVVLHSDDYFQVKFTAVNFTPKGVLQPCTGLDGLRARVTYVPGHVDGVLGAITAVQLSKPAH